MKQVDFEHLIAGWREANVISPEQAQYMVADLRQSTSEQSGSKFISAVAVVGAAVLLAGVLLIIASNWQFLGKPVQLLCALLMPVLPLSIAYYFIEVRQSSSVLGAVTNIFGVGLIGGSIALIGQIYNLESGYTTLAWMWALLSLPFVFVFRRAENVSFSAFLVGAAILVSLIEGVGWRDEDVLIVTLTAFALVYSLLMYGTGTALRASPVWSPGARALRLLSAAVGSITLFIMTFEFYARIVTDVGWNDPSWIPISILLNLVFIGFLVFVLMRAFRYQEEHLAVSTVRLMFLYIIVKYFTLFSTMLDTGLFLILGGVLFIAGAWYLEKNKQRLIVFMRQDPPPPSVGDQHHTPVV